MTEKMYDFDKLNYIKDQIDIMSKFNQIEILRLLTKNNVTINENKNGVRINLSELQNNTLDDLMMYIKYVNAQELHLNKVEKEKENYKNTFFLKDNKAMAI